jgi:DNA-binding Lrp family transcriptional regulator
VATATGISQRTVHHDPTTDSPKGAVSIHLSRGHPYNTGYDRLPHAHPSMEFDVRRIGGLRKIDDVDRQLCALLRADPRMSNRALASTVGVTDETIATRLRRLRDEGVLATTAVIDWDAAGYSVHAMARVWVAGSRFRDVVGTLVGHPSTHAITETSGCCDGVISVLARGLDDLHRYVATQLRPLPGISRLQIELLLDDLTSPSG